MFFQSYSFMLIFLPICVFGYHILNHFKLYRFATSLILLASLYFYGAFSLEFLAVLIVSTLVNYFSGYAMHYQLSPWQKKAIFAFALIFNVGALVYFKYSNFFIENINTLFGSSLGALNLILPLGISFFTFQQLSYIIDSYKGSAPKYNLLDYSFFATFFPYVTSGPIAFHNEIIPQINDARRRKFSFENTSRGLTSFAIGLFKKVLVADMLGLAANWGFANIGALNTTTAVVVMLCYTFQLYFDFSGYCDMARGAAYLLNIELPQNFNSPYQATTIADFWKRWHMTMTRFFTKYIYFPLGGNRKGIVRTCVNTMIVFLISGLWHGANWTFVAWGAMHGAALVIYRIFKKPISHIKPALSWFLTFSFVNISWVFFRAPTLEKAVDFCSKLVNFDFGEINPHVTEVFITPIIDNFARVGGRLPLYFLPASCTIFLLACFVCVMQCKSTYERVETLKPTILKSTFYALLLFYSIASLTGVTTFLYFTF